MSEIERVANEVRGVHDLVIYVISKMKIVKCENPGFFNTGDCYLVYYGYDVDGETYTELYAWIGKYCDTDEFYAAYNYLAALTKALPKVIASGIERQYKETTRFCEVVDSKVSMVIYGGFKLSEANENETAFKEEGTNTLYQIKGATNPVLKEVPVDASSLNQDDVFILKTQKKLFLFEGRTANENEVAKGTAAFQKLARSHPELETVVIKNGEATQEFLGNVHASDVSQIPAVGGDDEEAEQTLPRQIVQAVGTDFKLICKGKFDKSVLDSSGVYIIQSDSLIIVWSGKETPSHCQDISIAYDAVSRYFTHYKIPDSVSISFVLEGNENEQFNLLFD